MPNLCTTLRKEAGRVWNRMDVARRLRLSLSEETLTEISLYNIASVHQDGDIVIDLATKRAEKKHGADWEWWLVHRQQGIGFRVQAKRLFPEGRYRSLTKAGADPYEQLNTLVEASRKERPRLVPLYCFYNFAHSEGTFNGPSRCCHSYRAPSFWGCSLAFPGQVKKVKSNRLKDLMEVLHPWHTLVCESKRGGLLAAAAQFVEDHGGPEDSPAGRREPPRRVQRLIELADQGRQQPDLYGYLDDAYPDDEFAEGVFGLIVMRDLRD